MPLEQILMKKFDTISKMSFVNNLHKCAFVELESELFSMKYNIVIDNSFINFYFFE